jgi:alpha-D-xyloside xylohydrolase
LENKVYETTHANINHDWAGIAPENLPQNNFSMTWQGKLLPPKSGEFELGAIVDDGIRVYINDELVIDSWMYRPTRYVSNRYTFEKGKEYKIKVDYFDAGGEAGIKLSWRMPEELIADSKKPATNLFQTTYLPADTDWYDFWTGKWYAGDQWVDVAVNIEKMPIFIKAGSILPMGQDKQSVVEKKEGEPITLTIYPGADATFTLYEDEGDNYNYESGKYSLIKFSWDDKKKRLTAHGREGSFEGMTNERLFVVKMGAKELSMLYNGKKMSVSF